VTPDGAWPIAPPTPRVDVLYTPAERTEALREDVVAGLTAAPKHLSPQWFYDDRGSQLFDAITRLPEYYPTERERDLLREHATDIGELTDANTLVELGSGTSDKTRVLLDSLAAHGSLRRFVPFDVSEETLRQSAAAIEEEYPGIEVHGVVGDFGRHLAALPAGHRRMIAFLGSTIGNLEPEPRASFLAAVANVLEPGEALLLGADLVKDVGRLEAAYNDSAGVTAEFNLNMLRVLNRELDADFDVSRFAHVARWDPDNEWIEMLLRSEGAQVARVGALDLEVPFAAGEDLRTEISSKFRRPRLERELAAAGFDTAAWWEHPTGDFALVVARVRGR
jgi:L-histidine N-alpha-methyltransferase